MNINEYKTPDQKFEDQLKSLVDNGELTQEMAQHVRKYRILFKDVDKNLEAAENILDSLKSGRLI